MSARIQELSLQPVIAETGERGYRDASEELADHLQRLQLLVRRGVEEFRAWRGGPPSGLGGIGVAETEVETLLRRAPWGPPAVEDRADVGELDSAIVERARRSCCRSRASAHEPPLCALARRLRLSSVELDVVLLCLAPEVDPAFGRLYAYLHDDVTRPRPTLGLALELLARDWRERLELRRALDACSTLVREEIVLLSATSGGAPLDQELALDGAVVRWLLGEEDAVPPQAQLEVLLLSPEAEAAARLALRTLAEPNPSGLLVTIEGPLGTGRRTLAAALAAACGTRIRRCDLGGLGSDAMGRLRRELRDARLRGEWPCLDATRLRPEQIEAAEAALNAVAAQPFPAAFLVCSEGLSPPLPPLRTMWIRLAVPGVGQRLVAWRRFLAAEGLRADDGVLEALANAFPLAPAQIQAAARDAAAWTAGSPEACGDRQRVSAKTLRNVCRARAGHHLERLAERVRTVHGWEDIVLPPDELRQLQEVIGAVQGRRQVLEAWDFGAKVSVSTGVSALFSGPSGTGKTMAAGIVAQELAMDLYRVDLARVVSKYIGETEKNLESLFDEARRAPAVLFFDEADALFGRRSEVRDAHDRYANVEVAYLLQRMDSFEGVTILATNLRKNIDHAFLRRVQFSVDFPQPGPALRLRIWHKVWPDRAERSQDVDLDFMAAQFDFSGGSIRNVALRAAYLAAQAGGLIGMTHLIAAARREFQKLGRLCTGDAFGRYAHLLPQDGFR